MRCLLFFVCAIIYTMVKLSSKLSLLLYLFFSAACFIYEEHIFRCLGVTLIRNWHKLYRKRQVLKKKRVKFSKNQTNMNTNKLKSLQTALYCYNYQTQQR